jgi:hypothetical protein
VEMEVLSASDDTLHCFIATVSPTADMHVCVTRGIVATNHEVPGMKTQTGRKVPVANEMHT